MKTDWESKIRLPEKKNKHRHGELLPNSIRCAIIGSSGSGKTTLMIDNYLLAPGWFHWKKVKHLYVYSKYQLLFY